MILHSDISATALRSLIHHKKILFAGNKKLKIYGLLQCGSGKRMLARNRVFFEDENEAIQSGYRACKKCTPVPGP
jgi:methylphosphotriester-DNA--protein-cysteine methyltransferase